MEECCGTCRYHVNDEDIDFICGCEDAGGYGEYTMFQDYCIYWEGRLEK